MFTSNSTRNTQVTIPKPCSQQWATMQPNEKGRYCHNCAKTVIDFTTMTDREILDFLASSSTNQCGRFQKNQLNRHLASANSTKTPTFIKMLTGLLLLGSTKQGVTQSITQSPTIHIEAKQQDAKQDSQAQKDQTPPTDTTKYIIYGKVIDNHYKEPIMFAPIDILGSNLNIETDENGKFSFTIPSSLVKEDIRLNVQYIGFSDKVISIKRTALPLQQPLLIALEAATSLQGIQNFKVGKVHLIEKKWWQFWK